MSSSIPLVRLASTAPVEHALRITGRYDPELFRASGLPQSPSADPLRFISLHSYLYLVELVSDREGPDFCCRAATPETLVMTGASGNAVRASRTVREALLNVAHVFHLAASQVFFLVKHVPGGLEITEAFSARSSQTALHAAHQQIAGMVSALGRMIDGQPLPALIKLSPHPIFGVEHLKQHLGPDVEACKERQLKIFVADAVLDRRFPWEPVQFAAFGKSLTTPACSSMSASARILIEGMVRDGNPCLDALARAANLSRRTMQRLLAAEGASYADLVDSVRRDLALASLRGTADSVSAIAGGIGYQNTSSLTRAVRRWTDDCPRNVRGSAQHIS
jgi:AraC-like DNA-binding protein